MDTDTITAPSPIPCTVCGGRIVWRYVPVPPDDVDSEGTCVECGTVY